jgi:hypothetical protein
MSIGSTKTSDEPVIAFAGSASQSNKRNLDLCDQILQAKTFDFARISQSPGHSERSCGAFGETNNEFSRK